MNAQFTEYQKWLTSDDGQRAMAQSGDNIMHLHSAWDAAWCAAVRQEREACAEIAENEPSGFYDMQTRRVIAAAIRARSEAIHVQA